MSGAAFPLFGVACVMLIVLPACALLASAALTALEHGGVGLFHRLTPRYLVITGSTLLPLGWFVSAGLHQAESRRAVLACLIAHDAKATCDEQALFAVILAGVALALGSRMIPLARGIRPSRSSRARGLLARVEGIVVSRPGLRALSGRVAITEEPGFAVGTQGFIRPRVLVGASFVERLTNDDLAAALAHELEHVTALDPLRYAILELSLRINPVGRWLLERHATRWRNAREAHCDREAVIRGASPLLLAQAIIHAARPHPRQTVALGAAEGAVLKRRVALLLAFADAPPRRCCSRGAVTFPTVVCGVVLALLLPHRTGTAALDLLHSGAERAASHFSP